MTASLRPRVQRLRRAGRRQLQARVVRSRRVSRRLEDRIAWIFGSPRSGSTWLLRLLAEHRAVVPYDEPMIGHYLGAFTAELPAVAAADLDPGNCTLGRLSRRTPSHFFSDASEDVWSPMLGDLLRARVLYHATAAPLSRTVVVVKEPNGSQGADLIMRALPQARMLFLLRDGRDVIDSHLAGLLEGAWLTRKYEVMREIMPDKRLDFVVDEARRWLWRTEVVQAAFAAHSGQKLLVRYEDLRQDPVSRMDGVFQWLGLPVSDADLTALVDRHAFERIPDDLRGGRERDRAAEPGRWRTSLNSEEQEAVDRIIGPKLRELGYQ